MYKQFLWTSCLRDALAIQSMANFVSKRADDAADVVTDIAEIVSGSVDEANAIVSTIPDTAIAYVVSDTDSNVLVGVPTKQLYIALRDGVESITCTDGSVISTDVVAEQFGNSLMSWRAVGDALSVIASDTNASVTAKVSAFANKMTISMGNLTNQAMALGSQVIQAFENAGTSAIDAANYIIGLMGVGKVKDDEATTPSLVPDNTIADTTGASAWSALGAKLATGWDGVKAIASDIWNGIKGFASSVFGVAWSKVKTVAQRADGSLNSFSFSSVGDNNFSEFASIARWSPTNMSEDAYAMLMSKLRTDSYVHTQTPGSDIYLYLQSILKDDGSTVLVPQVNRYLRPININNFRRYFPGWEQRSIGSGDNVVNLYLPAAGVKMSVGDFVSRVQSLIKDELTASYSSDIDMFNSLYVAMSLDVCFMYLLSQDTYGADVSKEVTFYPENSSVQGVMGAYYKNLTHIFGGSPNYIIPDTVETTNINLYNTLTLEYGSPITVTTSVISQSTLTSFVLGMFSDDYATDGYTPYARTNGVTPGRFSILSDSQLASAATAVALTTAIAVTAIALKTASWKVMKASRRVTAQQSALERRLTDKLLDPSTAKDAYSDVNKYRWKALVLNKVATALGQPTGSLITNALSFVTGRVSATVSDAVKQVTNGGDVSQSNSSTSIASATAPLQQQLSTIKSLIAG